MARGDALSGMAVGGLVGGEFKEDFVCVVLYCMVKLFDYKLRYVMGVGYLLDLVLCIVFGVDMYDCVYSSRTARFGTAFVFEGVF